MSDQPKPSIFIAVPAYRGWTRNECARSLMQLTYALATAGVSIGGKMPDQAGQSFACRKRLLRQAVSGIGVAEKQHPFVVDDAHATLSRGVAKLQ